MLTEISWFIALRLKASNTVLSLIFINHTWWKQTLKYGKNGHKLLDHTCISAAALAYILWLHACKITAT